MFSRPEPVLSKLVPELEPVMQRILRIKQSRSISRVIVIQSLQRF